jgi:hypothetical protein
MPRWALQRKGLRRLGRWRGGCFGGGVRYLTLKPKRIEAMRVGNNKTLVTFVTGKSSYTVTIDTETLLAVITQAQGSQGNASAAIK